MSEFEKWWQREWLGGDSGEAERCRRVAVYAFAAGQSASAARIAELEADCKVMAEGLLRTHKAANCGNNKAMGYIRHGAVLKVCPACLIAAKYMEG